MFPDLFLGGKWVADWEGVDALLARGSGVGWVEGGGGRCGGVEDVDYFVVVRWKCGEGVAEGGEEGLDVGFVVGVGAGWTPVRWVGEAVLVVD